MLHTNNYINTYDTAPQSKANRTNQFKFALSLHAPKRSPHNPSHSHAIEHRVQRRVLGEAERSSLGEIGLRKRVHFADVAVVERVEDLPLHERVAALQHSLHALCCRLHEVLGLHALPHVLDQGRLGVLEEYVWWWGDWRDREKGGGYGAQWAVRILFGNQWNIFIIIIFMLLWLSLSLIIIVILIVIVIMIIIIVILSLLLFI